MCYAGNNLNQLARKAKGGGPIYEEEIVREALTQIEGLQKIPHLRGCHREEGGMILGRRS